MKTYVKNFKQAGNEGYLSHNIGKTDRLPIGHYGRCKNLRNS